MLRKIHSFEQALEKLKYAQEQGIDLTKADSIKYQRIVSMLENIEHELNPSYLDEFLRSFGEPPYIMPQNLFDAEGKETIVVDVRGTSGSRFQRERAELALNILYPGSITYRYFGQPVKVLTGRWFANFRARLRGTHTFEENPIFTITRNNHSIDVFKPKTLQASMIPFSGNVLVCSRCISITDFDEVCPHNPFKRKYKLPSTSPIIVSQEIQRHKKATSKLRSPLSFILPEVTLLDSIKVGMAVLGFERSQFNRVVPVEYDPPIGVVVDTLFLLDKANQRVLYLFACPRQL